MLYPREWRHCSSLWLRLSQGILDLQVPLGMFPIIWVKWPWQWGSLELLRVSYGREFQFELSKIPYCLAPKCVRYLQRYRWISRRPTVQITEDFPIKSTGFILDLLENVESNVEIKGLDKHKSRGATCTEHMEENIHCLMNCCLLLIA
ncbi:uncharacterized protein LOC125870337 [Solanum stenotomum]|uniref:uncharacterized protein LOC125870337 n=1 Tax=Solanum stenotomum TaxID=172797 RepID=UPI0020D13A56|nr:uncharacterized protein LOC125870337 [Solanum stenotomum]